jgi:hypothetical protein
MQATRFHAKTRLGNKLHEADVDKVQGTDDSGSALRACSTFAWEVKHCAAKHEDLGWTESDVSEARRGEVLFPCFVWNASNRRCLGSLLLSDT